LEGLQVRENDRFVLANKPHFARFLLVDTERIAELTAWRDKIGVVGYVELAQRSWLDTNQINTALCIGEVGARVVLTTPALCADEPTFEDALWFACKELNPMLETFTTLFGIKNDIDIVVEHGLRPTTQLLHNLVQPRATLKDRFYT
jgi:hypothetical protein